jgi:hypothetical protein
LQVQAPFFLSPRDLHLAALCRAAMVSDKCEEWVNPWPEFARAKAASPFPELGDVMPYVPSGSITLRTRDTISSVVA